MNSIGVRLKELRNSSSQSEMAASVGVKQQNWARWESGVVSPSADMIIEICRAHACSADWLLGLTEERAAARGAGAAEAVWRSRARAAEAKLERVSRALAHALKGFEELQEAVR